MGSGTTHRNLCPCLGADRAGCQRGRGRFSRWHQSPSSWDGSFSCVRSVSPLTSLGPLSVSLDAMRWSREPLPTHFCCSPSQQKPCDGRSGLFPQAHRRSHSQRGGPCSFLPFFFLSALLGGGGLSRPIAYHYCVARGQSTAAIAARVCKQQWELVWLCSARVLPPLRRTQQTAVRAAIIFCRKHRLHLCASYSCIAARCVPKNPCGKTGFAASSVLVASHNK